MPYKKNTPPGITTVFLFCAQTLLFAQSEHITPYKFSSYEDPKNNTYTIPASCTHHIQRSKTDISNIIYYLSTPPNQKDYPIAILCGGSSSKDSISSIIIFHRYLLQELLDLGIGVITVEQQGVDGHNINLDIFMNHYTPTQRLNDHKKVITHLNNNRPDKWNGKFIFLGVSEGGPIVTSLTQTYSHQTIATINWCGAGDWNWRKELWAFIVAMKKNNALWYRKQDDTLPFVLPESEDQLYTIMDSMLKNPSFTEEFMGMTYAYHADAEYYPLPNYSKLNTPYLVVAGTKNSIISSADTFAQKAKNAGTPITYFRIDDMDHYIRKRPDIIKQTFTWLQSIIQPKKRFD